MAEALAGMKRTHLCGTLREEQIGEEITVMGWVAKSRNLGSLYFVDVRDYTGILQVVFDHDTEPELFERANLLKSEYVIGVTGTLRQRSSINDQLPTGRVELAVSQLKILSESEVPPIYIRDDDTVQEAIRLKNRTLDLRKPRMQEILRTRSEMYKVTRDYFYDQGFVEVETPILSKPTPEGARDYLVPSRPHPGSFYALPQSPQLMKQLLMCSGFDRYIQIARCFRDEDLRFNRQPEFTQIDMELSFVEEEDIIALNEGYLKQLFKAIKGMELETPFPRITYRESMDRFGVDKPDVRFGMELRDLSDIVADIDFNVFKGALSSGGSVRGIAVPGGASHYSRKKLDKLTDFAKTYKAKGLIWIKVNEDGFQSSVSKFVTDEKFQEMATAMDAQVGDLILVVADRNSVVYAALGNLRNHIAKELQMYDPSVVAPLWITEFPLFEYDEEEERYVAMHHPFTAPMDEDLDLLDSTPEVCRAKAYDIVINGDEMGGGSIRIHDPKIQAKMFKALGLGAEEAQDKFGFLLEAFKYGAPPHGGLAYGFDRLCMLLTEEENMRQVIAFPKTQSASDPLTGAPIPLAQEQLEEVHIQVLEEEEVNE
ncbi:MAG: aspartate--tRNA ligase [Tissierellia bacterium]|nr:aspartate--tRNA ligase [Tissierellia bacterium]